MDSFSHKKIFLTGGTGTFGKSILSMLRRGFLPDTYFTILSRDPSDFLKKYPEFSGIRNVAYLCGDIRNFEFPAGHFDYIFHAAAPVVEKQQPGEIRDTILRGNERVIRFAKHSGAEKIFLPSSGAVYGPPEPGMTTIPETFPCNPVMEYGIAKLDAEKMLQTSGIYSCIARCFACTGPYLPRKVHFAMGNFIQDCLDGNAIIIKGDGTPYRSYLYLDDVVRWLFRILEAGENGRPYNVGSDQGLSILAQAQKIRSVLGTNNEINVLGKADPHSAPVHYVPDNTRIRTELKCRQTVSLEQAIQLSSVPQTYPK